MPPCSRGSAIATRPCSSVSLTTRPAAVPRPCTATPWPARRASSPSSRTSGRNAERVVERDHALGIGVCHVERPDRGAPQLLAVGVAEVGDQACARRCPTSTRSRSRAGRRLATLLEAVDRRPRARRARRRRRRGPARRRAGRRSSPPSRPAGAGALLPTGRSRSPVRDDAGLDDLALGVAGARDGAEARGHLVGLAQRHQEPLDARRPPQQHQQQPRGERVQRAGVADLDPVPVPTACARRCRVM